MVRISDARMSGTAFGTIVLHVAPESAAGGPLALVQTGDETLDYRLAVEKFTDAHCIVREGGNHSYENYVSELPAIFEFLLSRIDHFER